MKKSYKSFDELPMMISVSQVAKVLRISRTRSYELVNEKGFPKIKIGTRIVVSFWSVPKMAKKCNMCPTTCRNTLKSLEEKGYIDITQRFFENAQQSNIYTVHQI